MRNSWLVFGKKTWNKTKPPKSRLGTRCLFLRCKNKLIPHYFFPSVVEMAFCVDRSLEIVLASQCVVDLKNSSSALLTSHLWDLASHVDVAQPVPGVSFSSPTPLSLLRVPFHVTLKSAEPRAVTRSWTLLRKWDLGHVSPLLLLCQTGVGDPFCWCCAVVSDYVSCETIPALPFTCNRWHGWIWAESGIVHRGITL